MAEINRKELRRQIRDKLFGNIYLLYGQEKMYVRADTDFLVTSLMGKHPQEFNYHNFKEDYTMEDVAVAVQIVPFVSKYNCVKISDFDANACSKSEFEQFTAILQNVPDTTVLILTMPTLVHDPKKPGANFSKMLTYIKKHGIVCKAEKESDISLARQIVKWADKRGVKIEQADAYKIQEYVGSDLNLIKNELDKLCNYVGDNGYITTEHIELLTTKMPEANIFNLTDAIVSCNGTKAYTILDTLFYQKEEPSDIVNVISMAYIDYYRVRVAGECSIPLSKVAKDFDYGRREFVLEKAARKTRKISTQALRKSINEITQVSTMLRSESVDRRILVETLVAKLMLYAGGGEQP